MQSFFSKIPGVSSRSGASESSPPSYRSPSFFHLRTPTAQSTQARSVTTDITNPASAIGDFNAFTNRYGAEIPSKFTFDDAGTHHGPARLIKIHHMGGSVLTYDTSWLQELEQAARGLYLIDNRSSIFISVMIPTIPNAQIRIDARAWNVIHKEISEVWLTVQPFDPIATHTILMEPIDSDVNDGQSVTINVHPEATIGDIKQVLSQKLPRYDPATLDIWTSGQYPCEVSNLLKNEHAASGSTYRISLRLSVNMSLSPSRGRVPGLNRRPISAFHDRGPVRSLFQVLEDPSNPAEISAPDPEAASAANPNLSRLLIMHYGDDDVLTECVDKYGDIVSLARQLFPIVENSLVFIEASIASLGTHRSRIDPRVWADLSKDISEVWITTETGLPRCRVITLSSIPDRHSPSLWMKVEEGARILDIKAALTRAYPLSPILTIQIMGPTKLLLGDNHPATENWYEYRASCTTCRQSRWRDSEDEEGRFYAIPEHLCLDPMDATEAMEHGTRPKPTDGKGAVKGS